MTAVQARPLVVDVAPTGSTQRWVQDSPVGPLTIEVSAAGVRHVLLGQTDDSAGRRPPAAPVADALDAYFAGDLDALAEVPVDLAGVTPFRQAVLTALRRVGAGRVTSYGALASEVGRPGAARAVGGAVGSNPVPVVIPCHRVLASGGAIGGYSGGLERKMWLLDHEGVGRAPAGQPPVPTSTPWRRR